MTQPAPLTAGQQITLRRVAYGQSDPASLNVQDLQRLRDLGLIEGPARAPAVTASGRRCFEGLSRPATLPQAGVEQALADMLRTLRQGRQRAR